MKKISSIIFLFILTATGLHAQKKYTLDNVQSIYLRSTGAIVENSQIKGYFFMYITDKIDKKTNQYNLEILDQNLNKVKEIAFEDSKDVTLMEGSYNSNSIAFLFRDDKKHTIELRIYGIDGTLKNSFIKSYDSRTSTLMNMTESLNKEETSNRLLFDIGKKGYVLIFPKLEGRKKYTYEIDFCSSQDKTHWTYVPQEDENEYAGAAILGYTDTLVLFTIGKKSKINNNNQASSQVDFINFYSKKLVTTYQNDNDKYLFSPISVSMKPNSNEFLLRFLL